MNYLFWRLDTKFCVHIEQINSNIDFDFGVKTCKAACLYTDSKVGVQSPKNRVTSPLALCVRRLLLSNGRLILCILVFL